MIYIFERLPKAIAPIGDLTKSFNNFSTNAEISKKVEAIQRLREQFYSNVNTMEQKPANQMVTEWDWMPCIQYLQVGVDLLELGVKNANFPYNFKLTSVLSPSREILIYDGRRGLIRQRGCGFDRNHHQQVLLRADGAQVLLGPPVPVPRGRPQ